MSNKYIYPRIKELCQQKGITIAKLERDLCFGVSSIQKWSKNVSPSTDKIELVAKYFGVSPDYLLGFSDFKESVEDVLKDDNLNEIKKMRDYLCAEDNQRMMESLRALFGCAFKKE